MAKVHAVVMAANIYLPNEDGEVVKCLKGEQLEIDGDIAKEILAGDEDAGRDARLTVVEMKKPRGRPRADQ